jgi:hypothetical protein
MKTAAEEDAYVAANMTTHKQLKFEIRLSDAEREVTTRSLADTGRVSFQLEREIDGITVNEQKQFKKDYSICMVEFEAWWGTVWIQALRKTIKQHVIHFGYAVMHLVSHISESIRRMGSGGNFTTDISERLHIPNVKVAYQSGNKVNYL